jgi:hypothetical protein
MSTGFGLTTHYWMTVNGAIPKGAVRMCTIFDYAAMKLTGRAEPLMHSSGAASWGLFDSVNARWMETEIAACGMDPAYLQTSLSARELVESTDTYKARKAEEERQQQEREAEEKARIAADMKRRERIIAMNAIEDEELEKLNY